MARKNKLTGQEKRLKTLATETENQKRALVDQLRKTPIVQLACEKTGVGRATYYKWRAGDIIFARVADKAIEAGQFFINDLAESKLIGLIQENHLPAISLWLRHNHPKYATVNRIINEYEIVTDRPSAEERNSFSKEISLLMAEKFMPKFTVNDIKRKITEELRDEDKDKEIREKIEWYNDTPET